MSVEASLLVDGEEWNELVERSKQTTPFHRYEALEVMANHADATLYPFVGYKGQEPVGVFPLFSVSKWPFRTSFSPPPDLKIPYLGPAQLSNGQVKQRKSERRHSDFIEAVAEQMDEEISPHYTHVRTSTGYSDPRPLIWNGLTPTPSYTYVVDLTPDIDDVFMSFSSDIRRNVRQADDELDYEIEEGGPTEVEQVISRVKARHDEQNVSYNVTPGFARDLYRSLPDGCIRVYTCESEGRFLGGQITLEDDRTLYSWQTVADLDSDVPVTDLIDWETMQRAKSRGIERVDLIGANNPRLCQYKSKFNPKVRTHYSLEANGQIVGVFKSLYQRLI